MNKVVNNDSNNKTNTTICTIMISSSVICKKMELCTKNNNISANALDSGE